MTLTPAHHWIVVAPSPVDNNESETQSGLHVVTHNHPQRKVWRGVVVTVGDHMDFPPKGEVVHYTDFIELDGKHLVPDQNVIAWGSD